MKLRILGNKLRFRLTQSEVSRLANGKRVAEKVIIGKVTFSYGIIPVEKVTAPAQYQNDTLFLEIPKDTLRQWAEGEQVGIYITQQQKKGDLELAVEKDFQCLHKRAAEDETDQFMHPANSV
ncbi:MAG: hypothetical protein KI790_07455 [Cyclobacteriaceae bacterium]|nr:hypothetical protein [Cyclobacteriaceae bacterium HetDA_MAG_MS6]